MKSILAASLMTAFSASAAYADDPVFDFKCQLQASATQPEETVSGDFTLKEGKGLFEIGFPTADFHYQFKFSADFDLSKTGATKAVISIADVTNAGIVLASSVSVLHFDGMDEVSLSFRPEPDPANGNDPIVVNCSLKPGKTTF